MKPVVITPSGGRLPVADSLMGPTNEYTPVPNPSQEWGQKYNSATIEQSWSSDNRTRAYIVRGQPSADHVANLTSLPRISDVHPMNPWLICRAKRIEHMGDATNVFLVTCGYDYPQPGTRIGTRVSRWSIGAQQQKVEVDLDGNLIGSRILWKTGGTVPTDNKDRDTEAELGLDVLVPEIALEVEMPSPWRFTILGNSQFWMGVNNASFFGIAAGYVQYLGASAEWVGPQSYDHHVVHHFRAGGLQIPSQFQGDAGTSFLGLQYGISFRFGRNDNNDRIPVKLIKHRLYNQVNLDALMLGC